MGKLATTSHITHGSSHPGRIVRLKQERKRLERRLASVDAKLSTMTSARRSLTAAQVDRLIDEMTDGLPDLPPLPADFSRADLYDDHD